MARSFYSYIKEARKTPKEDKLVELQWQRKRERRNQGAIERIERPTRPDKARELGYKVKQDIIVVRVSVRKGGVRKQRHEAGRRTKRQGVNRIDRRKSTPRIVEERASRKHPNPRVLNSYGVGQDGSQKWWGVILVDPEYPVIQNDDDLSWIRNGTHEGRTFRGLINVGKKNCGLQNRSKGTEYNRPFIRIGNGRGK